jgi:2-phospho-L-lactate transferase/gluconeogenesis factor (CofD/UPF0052 family)
MHQKRKVILVSAAGGHGLQTVMQSLVYNPMDAEWILIVNSFDSGGHSRYIRYLFADEPTTIPLGDVRNNIGTILATRGKENDKAIAALFQDRVSTDNADDLRDKLKAKVAELARLLQGRVDESVIETFLGTCNGFIDEYHKRHTQALTDGSVETTLTKKHSVGNIILTALQREFKQDGMVRMLKDLDIVPEHIDFHFMAEHRLHLEGRDIMGRFYPTEEAIDHAKTEISLSDLRLVNDDATRSEFTDIPEQLIQDVERADIIIIPTGSQANSFPFTNNLLRDCMNRGIQIPPILRLVNLAKGPQEVRYEQEKLFLEQQGICPIYLVCKGIHVSPELIADSSIDTVLQTYQQKEGKTLQLAQMSEIHESPIEGIVIAGLTAEMYPIYDNKENGEGPMVVDAGLRHNKGQVSQVLTAALENSGQRREVMVEGIKTELQDKTRQEIETKD